MICKFCGEVLADETSVCAHCGKDNAQEEIVATQMPEFSVEEIGDGLPFEQEDMEDAALNQNRTKGKGWKIVAAVVCCVALLGALAVLVLQGMGIDLKPRQNDVFYKDSYTVSDKTAVRKANDIVATMGDAKLTNAQLQVLCWMPVDEFLRTNGTSYFDYKEPLDEQIAYKASGQTWQQVFIERAINSWHRYQLLWKLSEEGEYALIDEYKDSANDLFATLEEMAKEYKFENADAMIKEDMGAACVAKDYIDYIMLYNVAKLIISEKYDQWDPSLKDLEKYFTDNEAAFKQNGVTKESGYTVNVRHILVQLAEPAAASNGKVSYNDEQWEQCRQEAQALLDQWLAGDADEASFAQLANKHSKDGGSNTKGGLYSLVKKGYMVENFDNWIFDKARAVGDTGLVKTEFGYHIMYFVGSEDVWVTSARENFLLDKLEEELSMLEKDNPIQINYKNIAITEVER